MRIREKSYFSYGQIVYRGQQIHLRGRLHIDRRNAMMWGDYELEGILENARVTGLPIQTAARVSPGTGISAMQMIQAMRDGILIPWHKQASEHLRSALDLIHSDQGGMIYQPIVGLHSNVGEIDFVSMYPSIMIRRNISPEKTPVGLTDPIPENLGLIPRTLLPLLEKRVAYKQSISGLSAWDPRRTMFRARAMADKWLLVVCFGYLGYKNARFGQINSHEAVTAGSREGLLMAKEVAEELGYEVLQMYVDGLWVRHPGCTQPEQYRELLDKIKEQTGLPIVLDGIFRWVAFLPSRVDERIPVANRYFGVFQDGTIKIRGLEARRRDTAPWVSETQMALVQHLAQAPDADHLREYLPGAMEVLARSVRDLREGKIALERLLVKQRLSRELEDYRSPSPAARAARQLASIGNHLSPGQSVRFLFMRGEPGVRPWDLLDPPDPRGIDVKRYLKLVLRAAENVFQPIGVDRENLRSWIESKAIQASIFRSV